MRKKAYKALSRLQSKFLSVGGLDVMMNMDKDLFLIESKRIFKDYYKGKYNSRYYLKKFNELNGSLYNRFKNNQETRYDKVRIENASVELLNLKEDNPGKVIIKLPKKEVKKDIRTEFIPISTPYWFYKDQLIDIKNLNKPIVIEINNRPETEYNNPAFALLGYVSFRDSIFKEFDSSVILEIVDMEDYFLFNFVSP